MAGQGRDYEELACCEVAGVHVRKLRSRKTGMLVCLAAVQGPMVNGYFALG